MSGKRRSFVWALEFEAKPRAKHRHSKASSLRGDMYTFPVHGGSGECGIKGRYSAVPLDPKRVQRIVHRVARGRGIIAAKQARMNWIHAGTRRCRGSKKWNGWRNFLEGDGLVVSCITTGRIPLKRSQWQCMRAQIDAILLRRRSIQVCQIELVLANLSFLLCI